MSKKSNNNLIMPGNIDNYIMYEVKINNQKFGMKINIDETTFFTAFNEIREQMIKSLPKIVDMVINNKTNAK